MRTRRRALNWPLDGQGNTDASVVSDRRRADSPDPNQDFHVEYHPMYGALKRRVLPNGEIRMSNRRLIFATLTLTFLISTAAIAQQAQPSVPPPGSPAATITIPGDQLPAPPQKFGGKIGREATQSKPYWPARVVPPKGAPNVLLIITDDSGFGVPSTFGGVIPTPALDRIARDGLRYTNFHSTALCSPTRAALITGRNHHSAGFGVISEQATGFPGYN